MFIWQQIKWEKDLQPQVKNIISSRRVYWLGQPCKAGWQPPALGRWYCQAPTGWLELRPVRRPHPSHYSLHYFTTPLERPSPLVARRRHRPPLCSNVCTQTMSLQQILFYQLLIVLQISVSSAAIQFEVLSPEGGDYHTQYFHDLYAFKSIVLFQWCWKSTLCWVPSVFMNSEQLNTLLVLQYIRTRGKIRHWCIGQAENMDFEKAEKCYIAAAAGKRGSGWRRWITRLLSPCTSNQHRSFQQKNSSREIYYHNIFLLVCNKPKVVKGN